MIEFRRGLYTRDLSQKQLFFAALTDYGMITPSGMPRNGIWEPVWGVNAGGSGIRGCLGGLSMSLEIVHEDSLMVKDQFRQGVLSEQRCLFGVVRSHERSLSRGDEHIGDGVQPAVAVGV